MFPTVFRTSCKERSGGGRKGEGGGVGRRRRRGGVGRGRKEVEASRREGKRKGCGQEVNYETIAGGAVKRRPLVIKFSGDGAEQSCSL